MGISTIQSYLGAQIFEAIGLHKDFVDRYFTWTASRIGGIGIDVVAAEALARHRHAFPERPVGAPGARVGRRVPVAPRRRVPPLQPRDGVQAPARHARRPVQDLQGVHGARRLPEPEPGDPARALRVPLRRVAGAARRSGARRVDHEALRHRRHVVRLDRPRGARDAGHRHEPPRRQVQHRRGRRGPRALPARPERRLAPERDQADRVRALRRDQRVPGQRGRSPDQDGPGRQARRGRPAPRRTRSTRGSPRCATRRRASA